MKKIKDNRWIIYIVGGFALATTGHITDNKIFELSGYVLLFMGVYFEDI